MADHDWSYRITVSAMLANSTAASLGDWVEQVRRAKAQVDAIMAAPAKGGASPAMREGKERVSEAKKAADELKRIREKENDDILRDVEKHTRAKERGLERIAELQKRHAKEEQQRNEKIVSSSLGYMRKALGGASRVAGELVSGMGVSFDVSSAMQRGANVDETARRTAISGMGAKDLNASEADVQHVIATVRAAGDASKQSYVSMAEGLEEFVSKSSDLATGEKVLGDLGKIARATGTDVKFLVSAAGDVNKTLDDSPHKAQDLLDIMTLVATQSAKGAVEVKDFAKYMGRITAGAFKFEGTKQQNIGILSSLAQVAMKGGASGAREATNAAQAFSQDITKGRALQGFEKADIDVFADKGHTMLRSPEKIITDFLRKSKGSLSDLSALFQNEGSRRVVTGYSSIYTAAGGGDKGIKAVEDEFKKFAMTMSPEDIKKRAELAEAGKAAKAQEFQNKVDTIVDSMATRVLPAFEKLAPDALKVADALASIVVSATNHPWTAVAAVIGGSIVAGIAKAALGDGIKAALTTALGKQAGGTIAVGIASFMITKAIINWAEKEIQKGGNASVAEEFERSMRPGANKAALLEGQREGMLKARAGAQASTDNSTAALARIDRKNSFGFGDVASALFGPIATGIDALAGSAGRDYLGGVVDPGQSVAGVSQARSDEPKRAEIESSIAANKDAIVALTGAIEKLGPQLAALAKSGVAAPTGGTVQQ